MKKGNLFTALVLLALVVCNTFTFTSCSSDSASDVDTIISTNPSNVNKSTDDPKIQVEDPYSVVLKALDITGEDCTTKGDVKNVTLFVFDEQGYYIKQISVDKANILNRRNIEIACPRTKNITVIAWGGLTENEEVSTLTPANIISDLQVAIKEKEGVSAGASDLFYGKITLNQSTEKQELIITRKASSLALKTNGIQKEEGAIYEYRISKTRSAFDATGELTGDEIEYIFPASFDEKGALSATTNAILPASTIKVELYKDGQLIFSAEKDQQGKSLSAAVGKQQNLLFEKTSKSFSTNLVVAPWGVVVQYVIVD